MTIPDRTITPDEFKRRMSRVCGNSRGWPSALGRFLGMRPQTVFDWNAGRKPIPGYAVATLESFEHMREHGLPLPDTFVFSYAKNNESQSNE